MTLDDIGHAVSQYTLKHGTNPTKLNLNEADAVKLITNMIGRGTLPGDLQEDAVLASKSKAETIKFFNNMKMMGMVVRVVPTVE